MLALDLRNRLKRSIGATVAATPAATTGDGLVAKLEDADERSHTAQKVDISCDYYRRHGARLDESPIELLRRRPSRPRPVLGCAGH